MRRARRVLLTLALSAWSASATRQSRAEKRSTIAAGQPPGDVGAITGPVNVVGTLGQNVASAVWEVQSAAAQVGRPVIQDPVAALAGAVSSAENVMQNLAPGRGLVTDALAKSQVASPSAPTAAKASTATAPAVPQAPVEPAPLNGVYCRGAACQYRPENSVQEAEALAKAGVSTPVKSFDETSVSQQDLSQKEFCRGLACPPGSGHAPEMSSERFVTRCMHLLADLGGGLQGDDESRGVVDVHQSAQKVCELRVDVHEVEFCKDYADVFAAALSPLFHEPTVGSARQVCSSTLNFMSSIKQAEIDLRLFDASSPPGGNSSATSGAAAFLSSGHVEIVAGSDDGVLPPVSVSSSLFSSCSQQVGVATKGKAQTAAKTVEMAKDWCAAQTIITSWNDVKGKQGQAHPEWTGETCLGITQAMAFAMREDMQGRNTIPAKKVCKNLFMAFGAVHGLDRLVDSAPMKTTRGIPPLGLTLPAGDPAMRKLLEDAEKRAQVFQHRLQAEEKAAQALKSAKAQVASYTSQVALLAVSRSAHLRHGSHAEEGA